MTEGDWQFYSDIPVPGWAHQSTHRQPGRLAPPPAGGSSVVGGTEFESDIPVPGFAHISTHDQPGMVGTERPQGWEFESDIPVPGSAHQSTYSAEYVEDPLAMVDDGAWTPDTNEQPSIGTAGSLPTAAEQAQTWAQWNATRQGVRNKWRQQGRPIGAAGRKVDLSRDRALDRRPGMRYRVSPWQGELPSVNTIASPGTY